MRAPRNEREAHAALSRTPARPAEPMLEEEAVTDVALVLASFAAVALAVVALFVWGLV